MTMDKKQLDPIVSPALDGLDGIRHAFFTRPGGVSEGIYAGLNTGLGSADDRTRVERNRQIAAEWLGARAGALATPYQVHSPDAVVTDQPFGTSRPEADAVVTAKPGLAIGILTADCGPVLFADPHARIAGAAHAGWKGATGGVLENTIAAMESLGARRERIVAVLGPMISGRNYEVGPEFVERLMALSSQNEAYLAPSQNPGHALFDLAGYIVARLEGAGVKASSTGHCTYDDEASFYSYRRKTHRGEPDYGRQLSAIILADD